MSLLRFFRRREPVSRVRMRVSWAEGPLSLLAGEQYDLPLGLSDRLIARQYAEGNLSREYSGDELVELLGNPQVVKIGG